VGVFYCATTNYSTARATCDFVWKRVYDTYWGRRIQTKLSAGRQVKSVWHLLWCDENPDKFQITEGGSPVVTKCG
jgi:hypothetical protein